LPRCFSKEAPTKIIGKWVKRGSVEAERAAVASVEDAEWFHSMLDGSACRKRDNTTAKDSGRFCRGSRYYRTLYSHVWVPSNCALVPMSVLLNRTSAVGSLFRDSRRTLLLIGDSLMGQLRHTLDCLLNALEDSDASTGSTNSSTEIGVNTTAAVIVTAAATNLSALTLRNKGGAVFEHGGFPIRNVTRQVALHTSIAKADIVLLNAGAHYNLAMHCTPERNQYPERFPECGTKKLRHAKPHHARRGDAAAAKYDLANDFSDFVARVWKGQRACLERVIWRETLPQHWGSIGGSYNEEQTTACSSVSSGSGGGGGGKQRGKSHASASGGASLPSVEEVARWRNHITTPLARDAGFGFLPTFDIALPRFDSHPPLAPVQRGLADCTHFCLDSALNAALSSLAINAIGSKLAALPPPVRPPVPSPHTAPAPAQVAET